jgi:replicative DNA helicase
MLLSQDRTLENVLDSIAFSENFKQHSDFLDIKINEELKEHVFQDIIKQLRLRKKINALFQNYDELDKVLESIKDGSFDSIDDLVEDYEVTIKTLYSNLMESNRAITIEAAASLDLLKDDYDSVIQMILKKYDKTNKTPTGFSVFDGILYGGYDPSRLYVWGGGPGSGKSTMLNNTILKSAITDTMILDSKEKKPKEGEINRVYIYVTCENTIEEALMRTYMPLFDKTIPEMLRDIREHGVDIRKRITEELEKHGSTIVMKYFPAMTISTIDLMGVIDETKEEYPDAKVAGLYVDYLDLLKTDTKYDLFRLQLGHVTLSLKTLAVHYNIPVITATQLGRQAYDITDSKDLSVTQISESVKKVEHADFVGLLGKDKFDKNIVHGMVGKNRSGESNVSVEFSVDFSMFKFRNATKSSVRKTPDKTEKVPFEGLKTF